MAESQEERQKRDDQIRDTIMSKLVETGEKDRLKDMLRDRLIQAGWRDELKEYCKEVIRKKGLEKVTVEELVAEITPHGRSKIPEEVKAELLKRIRFFLQSTWILGCLLKWCLLLVFWVFFVRQSVWSKFTSDSVRDHMLRRFDLDKAS